MKPTLKSICHLYFYIFALVWPILAILGLLCIIKGLCNIIPLNIVILFAEPKPELMFWNIHIILGSVLFVIGILAPIYLHILQTLNDD